MVVFGFKTLDKLPEKHKAKIHSVSDERNNGDGFWIYLNEGWADICFDHQNPTQTIHEQTISACIDRLKCCVKLKK